MRHEMAAGGVALLASLCVMAEPTRAQAPDRFTNLQVLPKDISRPDLSQTMRGWASALGVGCAHCHYGGNPDTLDGVDFASDAKWEKRTARSMFRMVQAVQTDYLAKMESRPLQGHAQRPAPVVVACATCHHGLVRPESLDAVLERVLQAEGPDAAVRTYEELRKEYLGRGSYDFSERSVNQLAERLMHDKRNREAAILLEASARLNPEAAWQQHLIGEARLADGDRARALAAFTRALALNPQNTLTRQRLDELQETKGSANP
jgi:tetratricopeptide (TPR) repeat protein